MKRNIFLIFAFCLLCLFNLLAQAADILEVINFGADKLLGNTLNSKKSFGLKPSLSDKYKVYGKPVLKLDISKYTGKKGSFGHPQLFFQYPGSMSCSDLKGYKHLQCMLINDAPPKIPALHWVIVIRDEKGKAYNERIAIKSGHCKVFNVSIDKLKNSLDITRIKSVTIFFKMPAADTCLYLSNLVALKKLEIPQFNEKLECVFDCPDASSFIKLDRSFTKSSDNSVSVPALKSARFFFDNYMVSDGILQGEVFSEESNGLFNVFFRYNEQNGDFYRFRIDTRQTPLSENFPAFHKMANSEIELNTGTFFSLPVPVKKWVNFKLIMKGNTFAAYVDNKLACIYQDLINPLSAGRLAVNAELSSYKMRSFKFSAPKGSFSKLPFRAVKEKHYFQIEDIKLLRMIKDGKEWEIKLKAKILENISELLPSWYTEKNKNTQFYNNKEFPFVIISNLQAGDNELFALNEVMPSNFLKKLNKGDSFEETLRICIPDLLKYKLPEAGEADISISIGRNENHKPASIRLPFRFKAGKKNWKIQDNVLYVDNQPMLPLKGSDGSYYVIIDSLDDDFVAQYKYLCDTDLLEKIKSDGKLPRDIVKLRLIDHVDCTKKDHEFSEDAGGKSRILQINGKKFRVTDNRTSKSISFFAYTMETPHPGNPHILLAESVNDIERVNTLRIHEEGGKYSRGIGGGTFTRNSRHDGKPYNFMFMFFPKRSKIRFTLSRLYSEEKVLPESGAAASNFWLFELDSPIDESGLPDYSEEKTEKRKTSVFLTGLQNVNKLRDDAVNKNFLDYLKFTGINQLEFYAINGNDVTTYARYNSKYFPPPSSDTSDWIFNIIPPAAKRGISVVPLIAPLSSREGTNGLTKESFQVDDKGKLISWGRAGFYMADPLRPEVQKLFKDVMCEVAEKVRKYKNVPAIGFKVNGVIGLCYPNEKAGYSKWDMQEFEKDTGVKVPPDASAYAWLKKNAWEKWINWRCRKMRKLWLEIRDAIQKINPKLKLMIKTVLPGEHPGRNIEYAKGMKPSEIMKIHGYDPALYRNDKDIILQMNMLVGADVYSTYWFPLAKNNYANKRKFNYDPDFLNSFKTRENASLELYFKYWEEHGIGPGEFWSGISHWGAATMYPPGRYYFEPLTRAIRINNVCDISFNSWELGTFGHEHALRKFNRVFRALPAVSPEGFEGSVESQPAADETLYIKWFGDRLAIVNDSDHPRKLKLKVPKRVKNAKKIIDLADFSVKGRFDKNAKDVEIEMNMDIYDIHTLVFK